MSTRTGVTMTELLVVIAIITVLTGLLLPGIALVRSKARSADARQMVRELTAAVETYRAEDPRNSYPPEADPMGSDPATMVLRSGARQVLDLLQERKLLQLRATALVDGVLTDPWRRTYRYTLRRPAAAGGWAGPTTIASDWNWDASRSRVRAWNERDPTVEAPFPYLWSYGPAGETAPVGSWIHADR